MVNDRTGAQNSHEADHRRPKGSDAEASVSGTGGNGTHRLTTLAPHESVEEADDMAHFAL
jgi:hypothetical protein